MARISGKRILILLGAALLIGAVTFLWWIGWFSRSPSNLLKDTLAKANAGDYDGALRNLSANAQKFYSDRPELFKATLDAITRNGTIEGVNIHSEFKFPLDWRFAGITYRIVYKDGDTQIGEDAFYVELGVWRQELQGTIEKLAPDFDIRDPARNARALAAAKVRLEDAFTDLPDTKFTLRLPEHCKWAAKDKLFRDDRLGTTIYARYSSRHSLDEMLQYSEATNWRNSKRKRKLSRQSDVEIAGLKGRIFEGEETSDQGVQWRLTILVLGSQRRALRWLARRHPSITS